MANSEAPAVAADAALPERETYTAKQVATRIGTDAKTLRKFFRSPASTVEAVGQGGRYEFDSADLPKIREEFTKWNSTKTTRTAKPADEKGPQRASTGRRVARNTPAPIEEDDEVLELDDDDIEELEDPSDEDIEELDDEIEEEDDPFVDDSLPY